MGLVGDDIVQSYLALLKCPFENCGRANACSDYMVRGQTSKPRLSLSDYTKEGGAMHGRSSLPITKLTSAFF